MRIGHVRALSVGNERVNVTTAHKILIATGIGFFLIYALWELADYARSGESQALLWSGAGTCAAVGLAVYLWRFIRSLGTS
jgi:hypothetical protein